MKDDPLLAALGRVAAEQESAREAWERAAPPVSDAQVDRATSRVLAQIAAERARPRVAPSRFRRVAWAGAIALPIAAGIALFVSRAEEPLPGYTLSVAGGVREERGADPGTGPIEVAARSTVVLVARPDARAGRDVQAKAFLSVNGAAVPVASTSQSAGSGALRVMVRGDDLVKAAGGTGLYDLLLVVERDGVDERRAIAPGAPIQGAGWVRLTAPVRVTAPDR